MTILKHGYVIDITTSPRSNPLAEVPVPA